MLSLSTTNSPGFVTFVYDKDSFLVMREKVQKYKQRNRRGRNSRPPSSPLRLRRDGRNASPNKPGKACAFAQTHRHTTDRTYVSACKIRICLL